MYSLKLEKKIITTTITLCSRVAFEFGLLWDNLREQCAALFRTLYERISRPQIAPQFLWPEQFSGFLRNEHQLTHGSSAVRLAYPYILNLNYLSFSAPFRVIVAFNALLNILFSVLCYVETGSEGMTGLPFK